MNFNTEVRPTIYLEKYYPIEGRKDFYKWVIQTPEGLARDFKDEVMYFDPFNYAQAKLVMDARRSVSRLEKLSKKLKLK